jgi:hypothetical protein
MSFLTKLNELAERVQRLEDDRRRTTRGRTNQVGAARYLNRSREYLRALHLRGEGPRRAADGTYSFDDLDSFADRNSASPGRALSGGAASVVSNSRT